MKINPIGPNQTEVEYDGGKTVFFSYRTAVAVFVPGEGAYYTGKKWSSTTNRHVNATVARWGCSRQTVSQEEIERLAG